MSRGRLSRVTVAAMRSPLQSAGVWAGRRSPICSPMIAITTSSSISVNAAAVAGTASATATAATKTLPLRFTVPLSVGREQRLAAAAAAG